VKPDPRLREKKPWPPSAELQQIKEGEERRIKNDIQKQPGREKADNKRRKRNARTSKCLLREGKKLLLASLEKEKRKRKIKKWYRWKTSNQEGAFSISQKMGRPQLKWRKKTRVAGKRKKGGHLFLARQSNWKKKNSVTWSLPWPWRRKAEDCITIESARSISVARA